MLQVQSAEAVETKADFVFLCAGSSHLQPESRSSDSFLQWVVTVVQYGIIDWNEKKLENSLLHLLRGDFRSITVLRRGNYPIAGKSTSSNQI